MRDDAQRRSKLTTSGGQRDPQPFGLPLMTEIGPPDRIFAYHRLRAGDVDLAPTKPQDGLLLCECDVDVRVQ